jgi:hypothetical protein
MKTTRIALVSLFAVLVAGCGAISLPGQGGYLADGPNAGKRIRSEEVKTCTTASCELDVSVFMEGARCFAKVEKKHLRLTRTGRVNIHWRIVTSIGEFVQQPGRADGISPRDPMKFGGRAPGAKRFHLHVDNPAPPAVFFEEYDVNTTVGGVECKPLDPYIMN